MMRFDFSCFTQVILFIPVLILFQNCVVYNKQPVSLEQAINVDHKVVKPIKVELINGSELIVDSVYYEDNQLHGLRVSPKKEKIMYEKREKITEDRYHVDYYYKWEYQKKEIKIEEDEILKIFIPDRPKNNIYVNLGGGGFFYSINYERLFTVSQSLILAAGFGIGRGTNFPIWVDYSYRTFPHHITLNLGKRKSFFEFGIGGTAAYGTYICIYHSHPDHKKYYIFPIIGFRIQPMRPPVGFYFKIQGIYPITIYENEDKEEWLDPLIIPIGISLGISF